jgi:hypothetical protein
VNANDLEPILQTLGLAGAALYAARYLATRLEATQDRLFTVLAETIARNTATLERVERQLEKLEP